MSAHRKQWHMREAAPERLLRTSAYHPLITQLLYQRLYEQPADGDAVAGDAQFQAAVAAFLEDTYPGGLHSTFAMKGMREASARIAQAIAAGEEIAVYGDFDTDGITAVTLLMQALPAMGGRVRPYIPHRHREGYGLNNAAIEQLAAAGVTLLITVDCGISNAAEIARAQALGLDVIVTDHHRPPPELPPAHAVVNPKQPGCAYPFDQLVGVGIAFKLVQALFKQGIPLAGVRGRDMLDVVALGTVADMGPLRGENRVLVKAGLHALRESARPGIRALARAAGIDQRQIDAATIGYTLGPRLNAAGRLDDAILSYQLLLADDLQEAEILAQQLNQKNRERQDLTRRVQAAACEHAELEGLHEQPIVLLDSDDFPAGVVGLVAARLVERWARPVVLVAREDDVARGSARSIPTFNIFQALSTCAELFDRFGGHSMAAGFTIASARIPELAARLHTLGEAQLSPALLQPTLYIDAEVALEDLSWDLLHTLNLMEPFGQGNPQPILLSRGVYARQIRTIGAEQQHLKLVLESERQPGSPPHRVAAIAFGLGHLAAPLQKYPRIDTVYTLEAHTWNNTHSLQVNVKDFRRA